MGEAISNEVLLERIENLIEINGSEHQRIEEQVRKTNGAVASLKMWRAFCVGGISVLTALVVPIVMMIVGNYFLR